MKTTPQTTIIIYIATLFEKPGKLHSDDFYGRLPPTLPPHPGFYFIYYSIYDFLLVGKLLKKFTSTLEPSTETMKKNRSTCNCSIVQLKLTSG